MKRVLLCLGLIFTLFLVGCSEKIEYNVNEEIRIANEYNAKFREIFSESVYLFRGYEDLTSFFEENQIEFVGETKERYNEEFFKENVMIIYYYIYPHLGYEQEYRFEYKKDTLLLTIIAYDKKDGVYAHAIDSGIKVIELKRSDIESKGKFEVKTKMESR